VLSNLQTIMNVDIQTVLSALSTISNVNNAGRLQLLQKSATLKHYDAH